MNKNKNFVTWSELLVVIFGLLATGLGFLAIVVDLLK